MEKIESENKKTIAVLFGGQSSEHEISCLSGATVAGAIDREKYEVLLIGITEEGRWLKVASVADIVSGAWRTSESAATLLPDAVLKSALVVEGGVAGLVPIDVVFPVLHGLYGEDGCVQGICELAQIPYVGCSVLSSAATMDKATANAVFEHAGIAHTPWLAYRREELAELDSVVNEIEQKLGYPVFVKPSNAGSSCGISKATDADELRRALLLAASHDNKLVIEAEVRGRELETAVLGDWDAKVSGVGEILAAAEFYDYDAKYHNPESKTPIDPELPAGKREEIRATALKAYRALDCSGLSRVDFFLEAGTNRVLLNEINTIPGFTSISMYPKLWEAAGVPLPELLEKLIESASVTPHRL